MTFPAFEPGPPVGSLCDWCGQPCHLYTAPLCPDCHNAKPGDRIAASMERMLARAGARG